MDLIGLLTMLGKTEARLVHGLIITGDLDEVCHSIIRAKLLKNNKSLALGINKYILFYIEAL
jgi:hypothetical protein